MRYHFRVQATVRLTEAQARQLLDQAVIAARALDVQVALIRPNPFIAILKCDPKIIGWELCRDGLYRPVWCGMTLDISDELYPSRQVKEVSALSRRLRAVREIGEAVNADQSR